MCNKLGVTLKVIGSTTIYTAKARTTTTTHRSYEGKKIDIQIFTTASEGATHTYAIAFWTGTIA
jgi:hypothetical protein